MKPTIYDIARLAGVSTATVSKVMNGTGKISEKTRKKILEISKQLNYEPSVVASALTGKKTYTLGLMVPDLGNPFFAELARNVEDRAHEHGFNVIICNTDNNAEKQLSYIRLMQQKSVDGIIVATGAASESGRTVMDAIGQKVPVALISREMPSWPASAVLVDDFAGGYAASEYLLRLGHTRIAVVAENFAIESSKERVRGYRKALEEAGVQSDDAYVRESDFSVEGGKKAAGELLDLAEPPTAIFACNDLLAIGVLQAARERGVPVPEKLSVVGFDNTILATVTDPPMTTIAQPIREMGCEVVDLIIREINDEKHVKQRIVLLPELVVRGTTSPIADSAFSDSTLSV